MSGEARVSDEPALDGGALVGGGVVDYIEGWYNTAPGALQRRLREPSGLRADDPPPRRHRGGLTDTIKVSGEPGQPQPGRAGGSPSLTLT